MAARHPLQDAAWGLRCTSPREWEQFLSAFQIYIGEAVMAVTDAPPGALVSVQGMARQCVALGRIFEHCEPARTETTVRAQE